MGVGLGAVVDDSPGDALGDAFGDKLSDALGGALVNALGGALGDLVKLVVLDLDQHFHAGDDVGLGAVLMMHLVMHLVMRLVLDFCDGIGA